MHLFSCIWSLQLIEKKTMHIAENLASITRAHACHNVIKNHRHDLNGWRKKYQYIEDKEKQKEAF